MRPTERLEEGTYIPPLEGGERTFLQKTERIIAAGALGVIIVNTDDEFFEAVSLSNPSFRSTIPVVMIKAKDA
jgi:hypothetical protein